MDKKITRRVVLGTIIGGLAAGPFVIRSLRKSDVSKNFVFGQYDRFEVDYKKITTDLTQEELKDAVNLLFKEREKWLKLRGFSANVSLSAKKSGEHQTKVEDISAGLSLKLTKTKDASCEVPFGFNLIASKLAQKNIFGPLLLIRARRRRFSKETKSIFS